MLKKYLAILLLCISNFLMVGHSIIPHKHEISNNTDVKLNHHIHAVVNNHEHHHHHHQNVDHQKPSDKKKDDKQSNIFEFYHHVSEYLRNDRELRTTVTEENNQNLKNVEIKFSQNKQIKEDITQIERAFYRDPDYNPPINYLSGLRAPPLFFS